jgi:hypothetical protein
MDKRQLAVEWLENELSRIGLTHEVIGDKIKQAKSMEKEQIIDAYAIGKYINEDDRELGEQYYNETYGK